jgi:preprotein translocase subunit YajC
MNMMRAGGIAMLVVMVAMFLVFRRREQRRQIYEPEVPGV